GGGARAPRRPRRGGPRRAGGRRPPVREARSAAPAECHQVAARRAYSIVLAIGLEQLDEGAVELLTGLLLEAAEQRHDRRRGVREDLPQLLAGLDVEPERAVLEVELEV